MNNDLKSESSEKIVILLIEDDAGDAFFIEEMLTSLSNSTFQIKHSNRLSDGLFNLKNEYYDLVLLDLSLPDAFGLETLHLVQAEAADVPVVVLTGYNDEATAFKAVQDGAQDYLIKGQVSSSLLTRAIHYAIERKHIDVKLRHLNLELQNSNRELERSRNEMARLNNERKELLHLLSHDLANPFSLIYSMILMMEKEPKLCTEWSSFMKNSAQNGIALIELVRKMNALDEKKSVLNLESHILKNLLENSFQILKARLDEKQIKLTVDIPPDVKVIVEPTSFINSVCNNILTNAIKFSERGGKIDIRTELKDSMVRIYFRDYGIGMPESLVQDLFNITKKTNRPGTEGEEGTGFGMPLMQKFVRAYGGEIEVQSKDIECHPADHGTTMIIKLKLA